MHKSRVEDFVSVGGSLQVTLFAELYGCWFEGADEILYDLGNLQESLCSDVEVRQLTLVWGAEPVRLAKAA